MGTINTVLGPITTEQLGITASHEHVAFGQWGWQWEADRWVSNSTIIQAAEEKISDFVALGGRTYVDLTGIGSFRDVERFRVIARETGINFVACTGFWTGMGTRAFMWNKPLDFIRDLLIHEITVGIDGTDAKAGVIKVGVSRGGKMSAMDVKVYTAAAQAAVATGVPILTHLSTDAHKQLDIFESQGLSPDRVVIGHADAGIDWDPQRNLEVARRGAYVGMDQIGYDSDKTPKVPWAMDPHERMRGIMALLEAGYAEHIVVSADADCVPLGWSSPPHSVAELIRGFVPAMKSLGVDDDTLDQLLVRTPARLLTQKGT
jgi:predicted metal-dependent phosphotriesterase family hydrolase